MKQFSYWIQGLALRGVLALVALWPLGARRKFMSFITEGLVRFTPLGRRITENLAYVWPDLDAARRDQIVRRVGRNVGRSLTGIWFNAEFASELTDLQPEGPGLDALKAARAAGKGAIIVSGHYGQWEAIRHVLKREGMEAGAIYRPNNNPYYEPIFRDGIELGGQPIIAKGRAGYRTMIAHIRSGGFMALLPDQHTGSGAAPLTFMGRPASTSLSAAELALRYDLPLVPAFAPDVDGTLRVILEAPIPPSDPETMMQAFNDRLGDWVGEHPEQWHWLHKRWKIKRA